jgi:hypothetical protein
MSYLHGVVIWKPTEKVIGLGFQDFTQSQLHTNSKGKKIMRGVTMKWITSICSRRYNE